MLVNSNLPKDDKSRIKYFLETSNFKFYLTGSRYFNSEHSKSDWDFFVQYDEALHNNLEHLGLMKLTFTSYSDDECVCVYRHYESRIDIQLVKDAVKKNIVQEHICQHPVLLKYFRSLPKIDRPAFWSAMLGLVSEKLGDGREREAKVKVYKPDVAAILRSMP